MRERDQGGMALVEAIVLIVALIVPLVWLLGMLGAVHRAALATSAAVREAGTAAGVSVDGAGAADLAGHAVAMALSDQGLDARRAQVRVSLPDGQHRGARLHVRVRYPVPMLSAPLLEDLPSIWVTADHLISLDRYRSR